MKNKMKLRATIQIAAKKTGSKGTNRKTKTQTAIAPNTFVKTNCAILPTNIATTPIIRRLGERKKTRPPYSPIRLGVKTAQVKPQNTDSIDRHKDIRSTWAISCFHFTASTTQLHKPNITTPPSTRQICKRGIFVSSSRNCLRSSCLVSLL